MVMKQLYIFYQGLITAFILLSSCRVLENIILFECFGDKLKDIKMMITETIINFVQEIINFPDFKLSTSALQQQIQHLLFLVNITDCCSDLSNVIEEHKQLMVCMFASLSIVKLRLWTKVNIKDKNMQGLGVELQVFQMSQDRDRWTGRGA